MEYTSLGSTDLVVSRLALGTWQAYGWESSDDSQFIRTVRAALECGITLFDTAEAYGNGHAEHLLGRALKSDREKVVIATKFPFQKSEPQQIRKSLERSLRRLNTDYIDLYQHHWPPKKPPLQESIGELLQLKAEGKIRAVGVCNWMRPEWEEYGHPEGIDTFQACYSLLWRSIERWEVQHCTKHGIGVLAYSPLCQGLLTGRFDRKAQMPSDIRQKNRFFREEFSSDVQAVVRTVKEIAAAINCTPTQVALRWLLDRGEIRSVIVGASSLDQMRDSCRTFDWSLSNEYRRKLTQVSEQFVTQFGDRESVWGWHSRS